MSEIEKKLPKKPPVITTAFVEDSEGGPCLFAQAAGTTIGNPRQGLLCRDDGKEIEAETGTRKKKV